MREYAICQFYSIQWHWTLFVLFVFSPVVHWLIVPLGYPVLVDILCHWDTRNQWHKQVGYLVSWLSVFSICQHDHANHCAIILLCCVTWWPGDLGDWWPPPGSVAGGVGGCCIKDTQFLSILPNPKSQWQYPQIQVGGHSVSSNPSRWTLSIAAF